MFVSVRTEPATESALSIALKRTCAAIPIGSAFATRRRNSFNSASHATHCIYPGSMKAFNLVAVLVACLAMAHIPSTAGRASIACSAYVHPCDCGLCPAIVDCSKVQSAECFCGRPGVQPGMYRHPYDLSKFWMCSCSRGIRYGVEVACPGRLIFSLTQKACTLPAVVFEAASVGAPLLREGQQCGGQAGQCGGDQAPCQDMAWKHKRCGGGLACRRLNAFYYMCQAAAGN